jgi:PAS domain S-box
VVENIPDCYFHVDAAWTLTYANAAAERLVGRKREDIVGHNLWELFPDAVGSTFQTEYQRALDEQRPVMFEEYYAGLEAWVEVNARPTGNGLAIFFRDVTRYRRALDQLEEGEVAYRDFLESATDLVHMLAPDGRVLFANRAWRETLGYTEEEIRTMNVLDVVAPESRDAARQGIADCLRGEEVPERELVVIAKNGRRVVVRGRSNCRFVDGQPVSTRAIFRDVTAEVEARELLAQSRRSEAASARAKTAFLDRMSHEMRTPLTAVIGFANLLVANRGGRLSPQEVEFARRIGAQGQNLLSIVEDVLAYAEIESRRVDLAIAPVELRTLIEEVCAAYDEIATRNGVTLERALPAMPVTIETDVTTLRRVLRYTVNDAVTRGGIERVVVALSMDGGAGRPEAITVRASCGGGAGAAHASQVSDPIARWSSESPSRNRSPRCSATSSRSSVTAAARSAPCGSAPHRAPRAAAATRARRRSTPCSTRHRWPSSPSIPTGRCDSGMRPPRSCSAGRQRRRWSTVSASFGPRTRRRSAI